ncbi:DUF790 family protein [Planctomycetaceae bacterium SH139]
MLRSEQAILRYQFSTGQVLPDQLRQGRHDHYLRAARTMIDIYRRGIGQTRQQLHGRVESVLSRLPDCPPRRIAAFCKLLDDRAEYYGDRRAARQLRQKLFALGAELHPLVAKPEGLFEHTFEAARQRASEELGRPWSEIEAQLFADVIELQTLREFPEIENPVDLLSQYNLAQYQACLYKATSMSVIAKSEFKTILRHAKLAGLMHRIELRERPRRYLFVFDGPTSMLRQTWRYGIRYACLLPKLLTLPDWELQAKVLGPKQRLFTLGLSPAHGLRSPLASPEEFDSQQEAEIADAWEQVQPAGWRMEREAEVLFQGQTVLTPDFVLWHQDHAKPVYVEFIGFWTPEYLAEKAIRLRQFCQTPAGASQPPNWILIFPKRTQGAAEPDWPDVPRLELGNRFDPYKLVAIAEELLGIQSRTDKPQSDR